MVVREVSQNRIPKGSAPSKISLIAVIHCLVLSLPSLVLSCVAYPWVLGRTTDQTSDESDWIQPIQLYAHFMRFKALCMLSKSPEGIDRNAFGSGVPSLSVEDSLFIDRIFSVVDTERSGLLDWPHYIKAMSALEQRYT